MRRHLHYFALALFFLAFLWDLVLWGAVPDLPEVGAMIEQSASHEAFLASLYLALGHPLDSFLPTLGTLGNSMMTSALDEGFARIIETPYLAMDVILNASYNSMHNWVKALYWAPPILLVAFAVLWATRPRTVNLVRRR